MFQKGYFAEKAHRTYCTKQEIIYSQSQSTTGWITFLLANYRVQTSFRLRTSLCTGVVFLNTSVQMLEPCLKSGHDHFLSRAFSLFSLDVGLLARSQYSEGPATDHLGKDCFWFPCVYKRMLRRFPRFQNATRVIPRLTKVIRSGITFVSRNVISRRFL